MICSQITSYNKFLTAYIKYFIYKLQYVGKLVNISLKFKNFNFKMIKFDLNLNFKMGKNRKIEQHTLLPLHAV